MLRQSLDRLREPPAVVAVRTARRDFVRTQRHRRKCVMKMRDASHRERTVAHICEIESGCGLESAMSWRTRAPRSITDWMGPSL